MAPEFVTVIVYVTASPKCATFGLVRIFCTFTLQMSCAICPKMLLMSLGDPGKYPPGDASADSRSESLSPRS
jgi:hypothetical protein